MGHFIIGTAGHIDHGKTALVKALTGIDTDRLKEEKERGITIDIGFAYWKEKITIIDVPGHERFIRNMVAGVCAIDFVLLVIAADDGIMKQTEEHFEILKLLHVTAGAVVVTKTDLTDEKRLMELDSEIKNFVKGSFLENAPIFKVSSVHNTGIEVLSSYLDVVANQTKPKKDNGIFRMNIDRSFSMKGFGTVVTGTVWSGMAAVDQILELLPPGKTVRIRGLQKHNQAVNNVRTGDRAAINIIGLDKNMIQRGFVLSMPECLKPVSSFYAKVYLLKSLKKPIDKSMKIRLHMGTAESFGAIKSISEPLIPGGEGYVKVVTKEPVLCVRGDRFILRETNSSMTLGGGMVLDHCQAMNDADKSYLRSVENDDLSEAMSQFISFHKVTTVGHMVSVFGLSPFMIETEINELAKQKQIRVFGDQGKSVVSQKHFLFLQVELLHRLKTFHENNPTEKGIKKSELKSVLCETDQSIFDFLIEEMKSKNQLNDEKEKVYLSDHRIQLNDKDTDRIKEIELRLYRDLFAPPSVEIITSGLGMTTSEVSRLLKIMLQTGKAVKSSENIYFHAEAVQLARQFVVDFIKKNGHIKITDFKNRFQTSRKFALSLLEYFDSIQVTSRNGDSRVLLNQ
jgi:selenocysteine-specific elongation factor